MVSVAFNCIFAAFQCDGFEKQPADRDTMDMFQKMLTIAHYHATRSAAKTQKTLVSLLQLLRSYLFVTVSRPSQFASHCIGDIGVSFYRVVLQYSALCFWIIGIKTCLRNLKNSRCTRTSTLEDLNT